jgi:hypothetical protein
VRDSLKRSIYLLTIWQERPASSEHAAVWRFSLEDARSGERWGFANLEQILAFLEKQMVVEGVSARDDNVQQTEGVTDEKQTG